VSLLAVRNVTLHFGGITALQDVSFDVEEGTTAGLIGPNGAGKTTTFNVITRLYGLDGGDVLADGKSLLRTPPSRIIRHGIAHTFQNAQPFATMTVLENVLVGAHAGSRFERERSVRRRALEALDLIDVAQFADQPAAGLPFGTLKRIELARALVSKPRLLLLDEPAGGLNHLEVESLAELLQRIRRELKVTLLLVEHHMGLVMKLSDHVNVLNFGRLIASGPPEEIQRNPEVIEAYLGGELDETAA
jgi:branched-chain amino acid transport system ATP-binding protein